MPVGLGGGDSGELAANACSFGVAHPPGYPFLMTLGHFWLKFAAHLPLNVSPAVKLHVLNVGIAHLGMQVLAAAIYLVVREGLHERNALICALASIAGTTVFALAPIVWEFSSTFEVFALNNLLCSLLLYLTARIFLFQGNGSTHDVGVNDRVKESQRDAQRHRLLCYGALVSGLALANQHTSVLFEIPLIALVLWHVWMPRILWRETRWTAIVSLFVYTFWFMCGLAMYAQSIWSGWWTKAQGSWGDSGSLYGLARHFLRSDYGTLKLFPGGASTASLGADALTSGNVGWLERTRLYGEALAHESLPGPAALAVAGIGALHTLGGSTTNFENRVDRVGVAWLSAFVFSLCVFHALSNMPIIDSQPHLAEIRKRFWQQPQLVVGLFFGIGVRALLRKLADLFHCKGAKAKSLLSCLAYLAALLLVLAGPTAGWAIGTYNRLRERAMSNAVGQIAQDVLDSVPEHGVLFTRGDMEWTGTQYLQQCTGARPDVTVLSTDLIPMPWFSAHLDRYPMMSKAHVGDTAHDLVAAQVAIAFSGRPEDWANLARASDGSAAPRLLPEGLIQVYRPPTRPRSKPFWTSTRIDDTRHLVKKFARSGDRSYIGTWEWMAALRRFQRAKAFFEAHASLIQSQELVLASPNATAEHMLSCARGLQRLLVDGLTNWHDVTDEDEIAVSDMNTGVMLLRAGELLHHPGLVSEAMHLFASALREARAGRAPRVVGHPSRATIENILATQDLRGGEAYF
ncbi:Transmembrane protein 260-like [Hondaea fermentalgiana]|uniref:Transmembrane protein 260-like n=1 Tax=Hondaea fermentalgiana TaxID=2315210 RepID=A0A2R5GHC9_9STRA|nr:Transmembrane protein 260-like [Hondaea fermentalgiana]|eukprot:GBG29749.1 Transmembrane protein 260-like [Hondaea fermentalgiana]